MRPSPDVEDSQLFECVGCGSRLRSPEGRRCDRCGGVLMNLGVERDL